MSSELDKEEVSSFRLIAVTDMPEGGSHIRMSARKDRIKPHLT